MKRRILILSVSLITPLTAYCTSSIDCARSGGSLPRGPTSNPGNVIAVVLPCNTSSVLFFLLMTPFVDKFPILTLQTVALSQATVPALPVGMAGLPGHRSASQQLKWSMGT